MDQNQMNRAAQPQRQAMPGMPRPQQQAAPQQRAMPGMPRPAQGMAPQQRPAPGMQQRPASGIPQQGVAGVPQEGVEKQLIVRMFLPDMPLLKATAKQLSAMPSVKLGMYGQSGEVLVVISARARTPAAATELTENAAAQLEAAMGDSVYARGKAPLAAVAVGEMQQDEATLCASDDETGRLLEEELQSVQSADKVFDFGQNSFRNVRMADKIADAALMDDEESTDPIQLSADRSYAVRKCTKADFGVAIANVEGGKVVCAAVTYGKMVYVRCIRPAPDALKAAAMSALDMVRRLTLGLDIPYARAFKAGQEIDWNVPVQQKATGKSSSRGNGGGGSRESRESSGKGSGKSLIGPFVLLIIVAIALGVGIWYVVNTFIIKDESSLPAGNSTSVSDSAPAQGDASAPAGASDPAASGAPVSSVSQPADSGAPVVHPFA